MCFRRSLGASITWERGGSQRIYSLWHWCNSAMFSPNIGSLAVMRRATCPCLGAILCLWGAFDFATHSIVCPFARWLRLVCLVSCILAPPFLFAFGLAFGFARVRRISHFDRRDPLLDCFFALRFYFLILPWAGLVGGELLENSGECSSATKAVVCLRLACVFEWGEAHVSYTIAFHPWPLPAAGGVSLFAPKVVQLGSSMALSKL